jgi:capsular exopolysaccharide synthesis family protein
VGALLDHAAVLEHHDPPGAADRGQAVCDHDRGAAREQPAQAGLDARLGVDVDVGGRLVEHEDAGVGDQRAGERHELALPRGELGAAFPDLGVVAVLERVDEGVGADRLGRRLELVLRRVRAPERDVVADRAGEEEALAAIPRLSSRAGKNPLDGAHGEYESYGLLAANLRLSHQGSGTLMITSAGPEEGKTTGALGLGRAVATLGLRVIVIEADLRRPRMAKYTGLRGTPGISEVISGTSKFEDALVWLDTGVRRRRSSQDDELLGILCAGTPALTPQRMLGSREMGRLIADAAKHAQIVIIDTAPLGTVNDAVTILNHVDAVLVVARVNRTTRDGARRTMRTLGNLSVRVPGLVVTDVPGPPAEYYGHPSSEDATTVPKRELRA